jgi:hypothetical protein
MKAMTRISASIFAKAPTARGASERLLQSALRLVRSDLATFILLVR